MKKHFSLGRIFQVALLGSGLLTVAGFFGALNWALDLASHFRVQYALIQTMCLIFFLLTRRWKMAAVPLLFLTINVAEILPSYSPPANSSSRPAAVTARLRIVQINVLRINENHLAASRYIEETRPDILGLIEINDRWLTALSPTLAEFPYQLVKTRDDNFGIGLFSRIPFSDAEIRYYGQGRLPTIVSRIQVGQKPVTIVLTHPPPPVVGDVLRGDLSHPQRRDEQLDALASARDQFDASLILMGDLNTSPWSYQFKRIQSRMNLFDSRRGFGIQPTWPAMFPLMLTPIDHFLLSNDIVTLDRKIGPYIGSDHFPLYIEVGITP